MSTRCQVKVEHLSHKEAVTLYHHCDGYPSNMVPLIASAYKPDWQHGRAGKVASFLCATDPDGFEPEDSHDLHGDIEWYYILEMDGSGDTFDIPVWKLKVHTIPYDGEVLPKLQGSLTINNSTTKKQIEKFAEKMESKG